MPQSWSQWTDVDPWLWSRRVPSLHREATPAVSARRVALTFFYCDQSMPFSSRLGCQLLYHGLIGHEKLLDSIGVEKVRCILACQRQQPSSNAYMCRTSTAVSQVVEARR